MSGALSPLPPWRVVATLAATPLSRTFQVAAATADGAGQFAVLRVDGPGAAHLGLDRGAEPAVLRVAAAAGLGPRLLQADASRGLLLTGWLPGRAWTAADLRAPGNAGRVARLLRRLHATPLPGPIVDLGAAIERYAARAGPGSAPLAAAARAHLARSLAGGNEPLCFCHNDATPGNVIALPDGELRLIDWEYAGLCHPGFDLAGLAVGAGLAPDAVRQLLAAYLGRDPTPDEIGRQGAWEAVCRALADLWRAAVATAPVEPDQGLMSTS